MGHTILSSHDKHLRDENHPPLLFIGLGGAGSSLVAAVKERFSEVSEVGRPPASVRFLSFDTDGRDVPPLEGSERITISVPNNAEFRDMYENTAANDLTTWLPAATADRIKGDLDRLGGDKTLGASGTRVIGRLSFYHSFATIHSRLKTELEALESVRGGRSQGLQASLRHPNVVVVSSVGGGTGTSILLDVLHLINHVSRALENNPAINAAPCWVHATLITPGLLSLANPRESSAMYPHWQANGYACLKELDAIVSGDRTFSARWAAGVNYTTKPAGTLKPEAAAKEVWLLGPVADDQSWRGTPPKSFDKWQEFTDEASLALHQLLTGQVYTTWFPISQGNYQKKVENSWVEQSPPETGEANRNRQIQRNAYGSFGAVTARLPWSHVVRQQGLMAEIDLLDLLNPDAAGAVGSTDLGAFLPEFVLYLQETLTEEDNRRQAAGAVSRLASALPRLGDLDLRQAPADLIERFALQFLTELSRPLNALLEKETSERKEDVETRAQALGWKLLESQSVRSFRTDVLGRMRSDLAADRIVCEGLPSSPTIPKGVLYEFLEKRLAAHSVAGVSALVEALQQALDKVSTNLTEALAGNGRDDHLLRLRSQLDGKIHKVKKVSWLTCLVRRLLGTSTDADADAELYQYQELSRAYGEAWGLHLKLMFAREAADVIRKELSHFASEELGDLGALLAAVRERAAGQVEAMRGIAEPRRIDRFLLLSREHSEQLREAYISRTRETDPGYQAALQDAKAGIINKEYHLGTRVVAYDDITNGVKNGDCSRHEAVEILAVCFHEIGETLANRFVPLEGIGFFEDRFQGLRNRQGGSVFDTLSDVMSASVPMIALTDRATLGGRGAPLRTQYLVHAADSCAKNDTCNGALASLWSVADTGRLCGHCFGNIAPAEKQIFCSGDRERLVTLSLITGFPLLSLKDAGEWYQEYRKELAVPTPMLHILDAPDQLPELLMENPLLRLGE